MSAMRRIALLAGAVAALGLSACRPTEQGRPTGFEQGKYQGVADEKLSEEMRRELQDRGGAQRN
jgi:hypothetical protein